MVEKSLLFSGNPRWLVAGRMNCKISQRKLGVVGPPPAPSTMLSGSPTLHQVACGASRGHLVQGRQEASATSLLVNSKSKEHLFGFEAQPSVRCNERGEETE